MKEERNLIQRTAALAPCLLAAALFLSGCGASASNSSASYMSGATASYDTAPQAVMETTAAASEEAGTALTGTSEITAQPAQGRKLIRTVNLSAETDAFDGLLAELQNQIAALSGYVERSDVSGSSMTSGNRPSSRYASMTVRIPSDRLDRFVELVQEKANVTYKSENTTDVTLQYSDLESRQKSLTIEQERIWALLEKADSLEAVISLEERLSEIRYQLESMESQLRLYDNQVDYSTVNITICEVTAFTPTEPESVGTRIHNGFLQNVEALGFFFTELVILVISAIPIWLPLLVLLVLVIILLKRFAKKPDKGKGLQKSSKLPSIGTVPKEEAGDGNDT